MACILSVLYPFIGLAAPAAPPPKPPDPSAVSPDASADYVVLFVLEGIGQESLKSGAMPTLSRLAKDGSVTWSATAVNPPLQLPTMASLLTGLPVERHGITWNAFEFIRGYPRPPTVFDYLDLSGGKDSAIFFMDERMYQLAKPEPYTDYQICGPLKPECNTDTIVRYIKDYFRKATSGQGHGHAILSLPHFLVVHLPEPGRVGADQGWDSKAYREALRSVDSAIASILDLYKELQLFKRTAVMVTSLNGIGEPKSGANGHDAGAVPKVPWIASGAGIKQGHVIKQPVSILDTGATVLRTLGLHTYTEWESRPVEEIFKSAPSHKADHAAAEGGRQ